MAAQPATEVGVIVSKFGQPRDADIAKAVVFIIAHRDPCGLSLAMVLDRREGRIVDCCFH
jgi:hypothetical protein